MLNDPERIPPTSTTVDQLQLELTLKEKENSILSERILQMQVKLNAWKSSTDQLKEKNCQLKESAKNVDVKYDHLFKVMKSLNVNIQTLEKDQKNLVKLAEDARQLITRAKDGMEFYRIELERQKDDNKLIRKELVESMMMGNQRNCINDKKDLENKPDVSNNRSGESLERLLKLYQERNVKLTAKLVECTNLINTIIAGTTTVKMIETSAQTEFSIFSD